MQNTCFSKGFIEFIIKLHSFDSLKQNDTLEYIELIKKMLIELLQNLFFGLYFPRK